MGWRTWLGPWQDRWRRPWPRGNRLARYVERLRREPNSGDLTWLAEAGSDASVARREWLRLQASMGLLVAQQDTLDDRTVSRVLRLLEAPRGVSATDPLADREAWTDCRMAYAEAASRRGSPEALIRRMARVLLSAAGIEYPSDELLTAADRRVADLRLTLNAALCDAVGGVVLPEGIRPSELRP